MTKIFYKILTVILGASTGGAILYNTWWCLFVSDKNPAGLFIWWCVFLFVILIGGLSLTLHCMEKAEE